MAWLNAKLKGQSFKLPYDFLAKSMNQKRGQLSKTTKNHSLPARTATGAVYVAVVTAAVCLGEGYLVALFGLIALLLLREFYGLFNSSAFSPSSTWGVSIGLSVYSSGVVGLYSQAIVPPYLPLVVTVSLSSIALLIVELFRNREHPFVNVGITLLGIGYIVAPLLLSHLIAPTSDLSEKEHPALPLLAVFIMVWCADTFAYAVGRKMGKHSLFPRISPAKSREGVVAGGIAAVVAGIGMASFLSHRPFLEYAAMGGLVAVFSPLGDLVESLLKRSLGVKDSGTVLPGHGGLLDRFDSLLVALPVVVVYQLLLERFAR